MYNDLSIKNFVTCTKVQVARVSALDAVLIMKPRSILSSRRYTVNEDNEEEFHNRVESMDFENGMEPVGPSSIATLNADMPVASPSGASTSTINLGGLFGVKQLKAKPILKKPCNVPIGVRGRRKSTFGRIESSSIADDPSWNNDIGVNAQEKGEMVSPGSDPNEETSRSNAELNVSSDAQEKGEMVLPSSHPNEETSRSNAELNANSDADMPLNGEKSPK